MSDLIDRQESKDISEINKFIDGLEEIFADLRERHVDDSVCGLCEYDGAYIGQPGDWCNECPGFDKDDCFKLSDETRKKWIEEIVNAYPDHTADISKKVEGDCIGRQAAIDAMKDMYRAAEKWLRDATDDVTKARAESCMATLVEIKLRIDKTMGKGLLTDDDCMEAAKSVLGEDELPAVQPERKKGNWVAVGECYVKCSECGLETTKNELRGIALFGKNEPYFCPNCGVDMRKENES